MEAQPDTTSLTVDLIQDKLSQVTSVFQRLVDKASLDPTEKAQVQETLQQLSVKRSTWPEHLRQKIQSYVQPLYKNTDILIKHRDHDKHVHDKNETLSSACHGNIEVI